MYKNDTTRSKFFWEFKKSKKEISKHPWAVLKVVPEHSNISKRYFLCFNDDYYKL